MRHKVATNLRITEKYEIYHCCGDVDEHIPPEGAENVTGYEASNRGDCEENEVIPGLDVHSFTWLIYIQMKQVSLSCMINTTSRITIM